MGQLVIDNFLDGKSKELDNIQSTASLALGKLFTEVHAHIGRKGNGSYLAWLVFKGYNQTTAMTHRNRYNLHRIAKTKKGKDVIQNSTIEAIGFISSLVGSEFKKVMVEIDKGISKNEIKEIIEDNKLLNSKDKKKRISIADLSDIDLLEHIDDIKELERYKRKIKDFGKIIKVADEAVSNLEIKLLNKNNLKLHDLK